MACVPYGSPARSWGGPLALLLRLSKQRVTLNIERDAQLPHESDFFLTSQTDAEVSLGLVGAAEVIEERVKDVVHVLEHRRVKPAVLLPWRVGQSQDHGYDVDSGGLL